MNNAIVTTLWVLGALSFAFVLLGTMRVAYEKASTKVHAVIDGTGTVVVLLLAIDIVVLIVLIVVGLVMM